MRTTKMGNNHDPERQLSAYLWALLRSASPASHSSRLPTVQRGQVLDDRDWQSIDRVGPSLQELFGIATATPARHKQSKSTCTTGL
jgi:hypothetical protein